jgi:hypothetical protein
VTICVHSFVKGLLNCPPSARTPAMMASLSPSGKAADVRTTSEKYWLGSGLNGRAFVIFSFLMLTCTQRGLTTSMPKLIARAYWGKSMWVEMMCVRLSRFVMDPFSPKGLDTAPSSSRLSCSCRLVSHCVYVYFATIASLPVWSSHRRARRLG